MKREVHLLAFGNAVLTGTGAQCPQPRPHRDGSAGGDDERARQRLIDAEVAVTQAQLVIIAAALRATQTSSMPLARLVFPKSDHVTASSATG